MTDKRISSNQRYNAERKAQAELMKRDLDRDQILTEIYKKSYDRLQKQIDQFYLAYAGKTGLTIQEAKKMASQMDVTKFGDRAAKAVREKDFSGPTNEWLRTYNLKMKVSRLELLKAELALEIQNLTTEVNEVFDKARVDEYLNEYKRQAGILGISSSGAKKRMQAILDADFYGQKFSARVWGGLGLRATLQRDVFASLNRIYTDMMGYKQERDRLAKKFGTSKSNAQRLIKTEIARINADVQLSMLKENGFTHMIFVAEPGACDLCGPLDQKAIPIEDVEKGVNMFPMHPNCRCSAYGHIKMDYKAGGSTLDREAPNGVWGEDKQTEAEQSMQKQINGQRQKAISVPFATYQEFEQDIKNAFEVIENNSEISKVEVRKLFKSGYYIGTLFEHEIFGSYSGKEVVIPDHMIAYALTNHRNQIKLHEFLKINEVINSPDFISEDIRGQENTFLLNKKIAENRFLEAGIEDKGGQFVFHFMLRDEKKNNKRLEKIKEKVKKYDTVNKKVYNISEE